MNAPPTVDEFLALVRKSGILEEKRLAAYVEKQRHPSLPTEPKKFADCLVRDGLLTHFQAEQFLQGKWRRFTIGNYKVLERIGAGGMGSVFLCEHKFMRRRAAVKVLPISQSNDPAALQRFYREARAVAALDHPNIVRAYDIDQEDNLHFLVMEYVDGSNLQEIVQRVGRLDPIRSAHYISQAAQGLQHAHEAAGLVHRDIKPGNIIVDRSGTVKVLDLGLARFFYDEEDLLTKKYDENVLGTADYLAPEQALDSHSVDIRGDIYSLGGTFYFCLTGVAPFSEGTVAQKLIWHQSRQPKPIQAFRSDVPAEIIAIVSKMMTKDPDQRYQTPLEVTHALEPWTQKSIPPPAEVEMPRLSLAARGNNVGETGTASVTPTPSCLLSSRGRKVWQVPASPIPQANARSAPLQSPPAKPAASVPGVCPIQGQEARPVAKPIVGTTSGKPQQAQTVDPTILPTELELADSVEEPAPLPEARILPGPKPDSSPCIKFAGVAGDTEDLTAKADTERPLKKPASSRRRRIKAAAHAKHRQHQPWWLWGSIGGGIAVVFVGTLVAIVLTGEKHKGNAPQVPEPPPALLVSPSGQGNAFPSVSDAIRKAKDKDHIIVADDIEEQLELTGSNKELLIEAKPGKAVVWRFPRSVASGRALVTLNGVGHLRIRGLTLDGRGRVDQVILIAGLSPGLTLEDIHLRGFRYRGILMANAAGTNAAPIAIHRVQAPTTESREAAIAFAVNPVVTSPKINQHIIVSECRFDGPYKTPVMQLGDTSVIKDVEFKENQPAHLFPDPR
jgi:serine/threonine protein kinase